MTTYLLNALPNSILVPTPGEVVTIVGLTEQEAAEKLGNFVSAVGHQSTADLLSQKLGVEVTMNRVTVNPVAGDSLVVAAFTPPRRLAERELFTPEEILGLPIKYGFIQF